MREYTRLEDRILDLQSIAFDFGLNFCVRCRLAALDASWPNDFDPICTSRRGTIGRLLWMFVENDPCLQNSPQNGIVLGPIRYFECAGLGFLFADARFPNQFVSGHRPSHCFNGRSYPAGALPTQR